LKGWGVFRVGTFEAGIPPTPAILLRGAAGGGGVTASEAQKKRHGLFSLENKGVREKSFRVRLHLKANAKSVS
jgi:hypothetical protein